MTVRLAEDRDFPAVLELWNHVIRETLITFNSEEKTLEELTRLIEDRRSADHPLFVAEHNDRVVGYAMYGPFRGGVGYARTVEHSIVLGAEAHGKGLGRALMDAIEDHARTRGIHSIFAGVSSANPDGRAFHAALGYQDIARLKEVGWKWGRWLDLWLMQKIL
jgi:phosphinothricin acetyltransferase